MPNLAHSRKQDPKRGAKREKGIRDLLINKAGWAAIPAPRQLTIIDKGITHIYRSRVMDFWRAFDILAVRRASRLLAIQSSTFTNVTHKFEQVEESVIWPLLIDPTALPFFQAQIWVWGHRVRDVGPDGVTPIPPPGWHYRIYEVDRNSGNGTYWKRIAACDSKGRAIEGWPTPEILRPLTVDVTADQSAETLGPA